MIYTLSQSLESSDQFYSIDLFSGSGGMSFGLEKAGFKTILFNELNQDAASTFETNMPHAQKIVGNIKEKLINKDLSKLLKNVKKRWNIKRDIDLVVGGPPCQGYSHRNHLRAQNKRENNIQKIEIESNHLYKDMIKFIKIVKPNTFLFENVVGLLTSKWNEKGRKGEIFKDLFDEFNAIKHYKLESSIIHAYEFGVPQNRPRIFILGVKKKLVKEKSLDIGEFDYEANKDQLISSLKKNRVIFPRYGAFDRSIIPSIPGAISDLDFKGWSEDHPYHKKSARTPFQKKMRLNLPSILARNGKKMSKLTEHKFSKHKEEVIEKFELMLQGEELPEVYKTKKFSQSVFPKKWDDLPTATILSMPDDFIHYKRPRTLSVREWARLQTFPDTFVFKGKRTTGGERRAGPDRDVPKYTQIGNAVPPFVAEGIGKIIINKILKN